MESLFLERCSFKLIVLWFQDPSDYVFSLQLILLIFFIKSPNNHNLVEHLADLLY